MRQVMKSRIEWPDKLRPMRRSHLASYGKQVGRGVTKPFPTMPAPLKGNLTL